MWIATLTALPFSFLVRGGAYDTSGQCASFISNFFFLFIGPPRCTQASWRANGALIARLVKVWFLHEDERLDGHKELQARAGCKSIGACAKNEGRTIVGNMEAIQELLQWGLQKQRTCAMKMASKQLLHTEQHLQIKVVVGSGSQSLAPTQEVNDFFGVPSALCPC